ncbi:MFS transporter [Paraglaciecola sp.]|nr:MFS transporter [Paraglaciecola sp.]MDB4281782.1 MFS transporter [Paraglaciecola sp.]
MLVTRPVNSAAAADQPRAIMAAVALSVIGVSFFMAMPVVVSAWSSYAGFSAREAGLLAAIDSGGGVAASLLVSMFIRKLNWRHIALTGITFAVVANLCSVSASTFLTMGLSRGLAGFGGGMIYALGLAALAHTHNTGRNFSILLFTQVSFGMIEINLFSYLLELGGMSGIYLSMAAAFVLSATLLRWLPRCGNGRTSAPSPEGRADLGLLPWMCLCAVFLFYISTGSFWAYIELIGLSGGLSAQLITDSLTYTQVLSLLGCVIAGWLSSRVGQSRPLIASLACAALAMYSLSQGVTTLSFVLVLCVFFLIWNAIDIYQLGTLGNMDHSGKYAAMVPAFQMTAGTLGPALAAWLLESQGSYQSVLLMAACSTTLAMLLYIYVYLQLRRSMPSVADAS